MIPISQTLKILHNTPQELRRTKAEEIDLSPPDKQTCILFSDAGLIALGTTPAGSTLRVYYQTPEGQIGETTL